MAISGVNTKVTLAGVDIAGINDASISINGETIDVTTFLSGGWVQKIQGLKSADISLSGFTVPGNAQQTALQTALINGDLVTLQVLPNGIAGWTGTFLPTSIEQSSSVSGEVTFSTSLESSGPVTVV